MPATGYVATSFTPGEVPTTALWNYLWSNDASFNNGNGFNDSILVNRHYAAGSITGDKYGQAPIIVLGKTANAVLSSATWTPIVYDMTVYNYGGYTVSTNQITVPFTGLYDVTVHNAFNNATTNTDTLAGLAKNTTTAPNFPWTRIFEGGTSPHVELNIPVKLTAGDKLTAFAYMGGSPTLFGGSFGGGDSSYMAIRYRGQQ